MVADEYFNDLRVQTLREALARANDVNAALQQRIAAVEALHHSKTFEGYSDHHHAASVAAIGAIAPYRHNCTEECFGTFTICDQDGITWPCPTVAALAGPEESQ